MKSIKSLLAAITISILPLVAEASPPLGVRVVEEDDSNTDYDCRVDTTGFDTCDLSCATATLNFECACYADVCECIGDSDFEFTMEADPSMDDWCDSLRRGGGHISVCCTDRNADGSCPKSCTITAPTGGPACSPCLYGCNPTTMECL